MFTFSSPVEVGKRERERERERETSNIFSSHKKLVEGWVLDNVGRNAE